MRGVHSRCVGWLAGLAGLALAALATEARAEALHYCYVPLETLFSIDDFVEPLGLDEDGRVYCQIFGLDPLPTIAVIDHGAVNTLPQAGYIHSVSKSGVIGGSVVDDPDTLAERAAIFRNGHVERLPRRPGELRSYVAAVNDAGTAVSLSFDDTSATVLLYQNGRLTPFDPAGAGQVPSFLHINDRGQISGTISGPYRGFQYDSHTGTTSILSPRSTEPNAWALGNNDRGDVVGYSFVFGGTERIGVWDQQGNFNEYFVEGPPRDHVVSDRLRINNQGFIVITVTSFGAGFHSYVVPQRGVRIDLADVVEGAPDEPTALWDVTDLNDHGDMVGFGLVGNAFLLQRKQGPCDAQ